MTTRSQLNVVISISLGTMCLFLSCDEPRVRPGVKPDLSGNWQVEMLDEVANKLLRVEMIVYESGRGRTGPILVTDKADIEEFKEFLHLVSGIEPMEQPHAAFTTEDEVNMTLVFDEIADFRARVVGPMFIFFDDEKCIGSLPMQQFDKFISRLVERHRREHPENWLRTKPPKDYK